MSDRSHSNQRPFYVPPPVKTCESIISEARNSLKRIKQERPFTPHGRATANAFSTSLKLQSSYDPESRPCSAAIQSIRLPPVEISDTRKLRKSVRPSSSSSNLSSSVAGKVFDPSTSGDTRRISSGDTTKRLEPLVLDDKQISTSSTNILNVNGGDSGFNSAKSRPNSTTILLQSTSLKESGSTPETAKVLARILNDMNEQPVNVDKNSHLVKELYDLLSTNSLFAKKSKSRTRILQCLFKQLEVECAELQIWSLCIIFCYGVSGKNLINAAKFVFKLYRDEKNDHIIAKTPLLGCCIKLMLLVETPLQDGILESLVYIAGSLKQFFSRTSNGSVALSVRLLPNLEKCIQDCLNLNLEQPEYRHHVCNILVQCTGCLRNVVNTDDSIVRVMLGVTVHDAGDTNSPPVPVPNKDVSQLLSAVIRCMNNLPSDTELVLNCCRVLSKLATFDEVCSLYLATDRMVASTMFSMLSLHQNQVDIVTRSLFVLSNIALTELFDTEKLAAVEIFNSNDCAEKVLVNGLQSNIKDVKRRLTRLITMKKSNNDNNNQEIVKQTLDKVECNLRIIDKFLGLIGNLAVESEVGMVMTSSPGILLACLDSFCVILECKHSVDKQVCRMTMSTLEELHSTCLTAISNLAYYQLPQTSEVYSACRAPLETLIRYAAKKLLQPVSPKKGSTTPTGANKRQSSIQKDRLKKIELLSCLSNLSQHAICRQMMLEARMCDICGQYLNSDDPDIVYWTAGMLTNLLAQSSPITLTFSQSDNIQSVIDAISAFTSQDDLNLTRNLLTCFGNTLKLTDKPAITRQSARQCYDVMLHVSEWCCELCGNDLADELYAIAIDIADKLEPMTNSMEVIVE